MECLTMDSLPPELYQALDNLGMEPDWFLKYKFKTYEEVEKFIETQTKEMGYNEVIPYCN